MTITLLALAVPIIGYVLPVYKEYFGDGDLAGIIFSCGVTLIGSAAVYYCEDFASTTHLSAL